MSIFNGRGWPVAILLFFFAACFLLFAYFSRRSQINEIEEAKEVEELWAKTVFPFGGIPSRFPIIRTNPSALELEKLAGSIGIDLVPKLPKNDRHKIVDERRAVEFKDIKKSMDRYLKEELERPSIDIHEPPKDLTVFMDALSKETSTIIKFLMQNTSPIWESNLPQMTEGPIPDLLGHADLQRIFSVFTLEKIRPGQAARCNRSLRSILEVEQCIIRSR